jgi:hypothetical protein
MRPCLPGHDWRPNDWHQQAERTRLRLYTQPRQRRRAVFGSYVTPVSSSINMQHIRLASVPDCHDPRALQHSTVKVFCAPGGNLWRRIRSNKLTMDGSTLCRVTIKALEFACPATPSLCSFPATCARSHPCPPPEQSVASLSLTTGGASLAAGPTSLECPVNRGY